MEKIVLDCQKCGGSLVITSDMEIFKCQYCGMPYLVEREEGSIKIVKLEQRVTQVEKKQEAQDIRLITMQIEEILAKIDRIEGEELQAAEHQMKWVLKSYYKEKGLLEKYEKLHHLTNEYIEIGGDREDIITFFNPYILVDELKGVFNENLIPKIARDASFVRFGTNTLPFLYKVKVVYTGRPPGIMRRMGKVLNNGLKIISTDEYLSDVENKIDELVQNRFFNYEVKAVSKKVHYILWIGISVISSICLFLFLLATES